MSISSPPSQGQLVEVRRRHFVVVDVARSTLAPDPFLAPASEPQHLLTLSSIEDDALGEELQVIWELEPGARPLERSTFPEPSGFDDPRRLEAFLDAVRWGAAVTIDAQTLQAPFRSGIEIESYQLDPVVRALQMPRVTMLIADDVGLGKTIEAGLVAQELILRHRVRTVLVVCPASIQIQWRDQMRDKFGLEFRIVDAELMRDLRRRRGLHVNPWTHFPRLVTSIDFLKRDRPMRLFRDVLPAEGEPAFPRRFDLMIVDEAHNVAPSGTGRYATDSLRTTAIRMLAPHFEHRLFLTATPHNGYPESFSALLELVDNQRFARGVPPDPVQKAAVMVRRLKSELKAEGDAGARFPKRTLVPLEVPYTREEKRVHAALVEYTRLRRAGATTEEERFASEFVLKLLKKRLFSSPAAFRGTLDKHEDSLKTARRGKRKVRTPTLGFLKSLAERVDEDVADEKVQEEHTAEALGTAASLFRDLTREERDLLTELKTYAKTASARGDTKAAEFVAWLKKTVKPAGRWNSGRVLIFTEYRDTQKWLLELLAREGLNEEGRLLTLYGGLDPERREEIKAAFQTTPHDSPVRILLATDAASEGIDLQNHCCRLVHYEIPWNPNRMEQRNGRIDRHGQKAPEVLIHHFVGKGYDKTALEPVRKPGDLEGDLEFLARAAEKVDRMREDLGSVGPVIAAQVEEAMLGVRHRFDTSEGERRSKPVKAALAFERKLREQIQTLRRQLDDSARELHFSPENILAVVAAGLELAEQAPLEEARLAGVWPDPTKQRSACPVFHMPPLRGSWAACSEGIEHPHTRRVRPITFDHAVAAGRDDVVLVHLNHRLVQMCLRLLRSEIWSGADYKKLHRLTVRLVPARELQSPVAVAHARLVILGGDNHRLHEELIVAGIRMQGSRLEPLSQSEAAALMGAATLESLDERRSGWLAAQWPRLSSSLLKALEARKRSLTDSLEKKIVQRAEQEAANMTAILGELERTIRAELENAGPEQLELFTGMEREQVERNRGSLRNRLTQIPGEVERETAAIRAHFADPRPWLFPVAVTFLVPEGFEPPRGGRS